MSSLPRFRWVRVPATGSVPRPRALSAAVFDDKGHNLYLFGGEDDQKHRLNGVYKLDLSRKFEWNIVQFVGAIPHGRCGHAAIKYLNSMVVFGGNSENGYPNNELYQLEFDSLLWTCLHPKSALPVPCVGHTFVKYGQMALLFGGYSSHPRKSFDGVSSCVPNNDVHILTLGKWSWKLNVGGGGPRPPPRWGHSAVINDTGMYIFGGFGLDYTMYNDLWCFDLETFEWIEVKPQDGAEPPAIYQHTANIVGRWMIVYGGIRSNFQRSDTALVYDFDTEQWTEIVPEGQGPTRRSSHLSTPFRGGFVIFSGIDDNGAFLDDTYYLDVKFSNGAVENSVFHTGISVAGDSTTNNLRNTMRSSNRSRPKS